MEWNDAIAAAPDLPADEVHVWRVALDLPEPQLGAAWQRLDPAERDRARRYHFERDRRRFVAGRGQLRAMLGRYLGVAPAAVAFSYMAHGKPLLAGPGDPALHFNLAHAVDRGLVALCRSAPVGVDIEAVRPTVDVAGLAGAFFAPEERSALLAQEPQAQILTFFRLWACKEAFLKAHGHGLALPLDSFAVALDGGPARLLYSRDDGDAWQLRELIAGAGFTAALAVASARLRVRYAAPV